MQTPASSPMTRFRVRPLSGQELQRRDKTIMNFPGDGAIWVSNTRLLSQCDVTVARHGGDAVTSHRCAMATSRYTQKSDHLFRYILRRIATT